MAVRSGLRKPRALQKGDWVGIAAPSSPFNPGAFRKGVSFLESAGFRVRFLPGLVARRRGFLAGEDRERAEELEALFEDREVKAVFSARGGYGAQRLLDRLDPKVFQANPKLFVGYSDVTCLLSFLVDVCRLVCVHGPLVTEMGCLPLRTRRHLLRCLTKAEPLGPLPLERPRWLHRGRVRAPVVGGNLSVIASGLGTPWELETAGRILFLEDRGEKPYRVDRMLVQLKQAGKLGAVAGLVFGRLDGAETGNEAGREKKLMREVVFDHAAGLGVPVLWGARAGHGGAHFALPLGVLAELDSRKGCFSFLEPAVEEPG